MIYYAIDIETSSGDPKTGQVFEVGIVLENTQIELDIDDLKSMRILVKHEEIHGSVSAINMNAKLIQEILDSEVTHARRAEPGLKVAHTNDCQIISSTGQTLSDLIENQNRTRVVLRSEDVGIALKQFIKHTSKSENRPTLAGKNLASFDLPFLNEQSGFDWYRHRVIDPSILYVNWEEDDWVPDLSVCKQRAGLGSHVSHTAVEDAMDIVKLIRIIMKMPGKSSGWAVD